MRLSKISSRLGDARPLKHPAGPVLGPIDLAREDPHDEMFLHAHAGDDCMGGMKHFENGPDALIAVGLQGADFGQRGARVGTQRRVPDDAGHVLQAGGEVAERFARQTVPNDARPPLRPRDFRDVRGIETVALGQAVGGRRRDLELRIENLGGQRGRVGVGGPGEQENEGGNLFSPDAGRGRQVAKRRAEQIPQSPPEEGQRQAAVVGQRPKGQRPLDVVRIGFGKEYLPQVFKAADELKLFDRSCLVKSHRVFLPSKFRFGTLRVGGRVRVLLQRCSLQWVGDRVGHPAHSNRVLVGIGRSASPLAVAVGPIFASPALHGQELPLNIRRKTGKNDNSG